MIALHTQHVRCRRCSRFRHPDDFAINPTVGYCRQCYEGHQRALKVLEGGVPKECTLCNAAFEDLMNAAGAGDIRMYVHLQDGLYGVMCQRCSDAYEHKRRDLYQATEYGAQKKIA